MLTNYFFNFRNVKFGWSQNNCRSFTNVRITLAKNAWRIWGAFQTRRCLAPSAKTYGSWQPYLSQSSKYLHNYLTLFGMGFEIDKKMSIFCKYPLGATFTSLRKLNMVSKIDDLYQLNMYFFPFFLAGSSVQLIRGSFVPK